MKRLLTFTLIILLLLSFVLSCTKDSDQNQSTTNTEQTEEKFIGSVNSDIYHYPSCKWAKKIKPKNEIVFTSVSDAKEKGYRACKVCKPPKK